MEKKIGVWINSAAPKPEFDSAVAMYVVWTVPRGNKLLKENLKQGEKKNDFPEQGSLKCIQS